MKIAFFSTQPYDQRFFEAANSTSGHHEFLFFPERLCAATAHLAAGCPAVCIFVNDELNADTLIQLHGTGLRLVALRCAGFNNVDLAAAGRLGITVVRVPAYSPHAVAEHAVALLMALNRRIHKAYNRVRDGNFALDGLLGVDIHGRTVGVIGTGQIGRVFATIMQGFGCEVLAFDPFPNPEVAAMGIPYLSLFEVFTRADILSLHCPLSPDTHHMVNADSIAKMKPGVMIVNTGRGALIDTPAAIDALKSGHIGALGIDVYEAESELFFRDLSTQVIADDVFTRLITMPNVLVTGHQAFFTQEAMEKIAGVTLDNCTAFETGKGKMFTVPTN